MGLRLVGLRLVGLRLVFFCLVGLRLVFFLSCGSILAFVITAACPEEASQSFASGLIEPQLYTFIVHYAP